MSDDAEQPTEDDVEGHGIRRSFAGDSDEPADDTDNHSAGRGRAIRAGRAPRPGRIAEEQETDDVTGHLSGALGALKHDEHRS